MAKAQKYLSLIILIVIFAFFLASTLGDEWLIYEVDHVGLWQTCRMSECTWMDRTPSYDVAFLDWYSCVRAFMILSCMFNVIAIFTQACNIYDEKTFSQSLVQTSMILTAIFVLIGIVVYACERHKSYEDNWGLGWAYYLACVAGILTLIAIVFLCTCVHDNQKTFKSTGYPPFATVPNQSAPVIPLVERVQPTIEMEEKVGNDYADGRVHLTDSKSNDWTSKSSTIKGSGSKQSVVKKEYSSLEEIRSGADYSDTESDISSASYTVDGSRTITSASEYSRTLTDQSQFL